MALIPVKYKAALLTAALVGSAAGGWVANGWRLGKKAQAVQTDYWQARARRGEDYSDTLVKAAHTASGRIQEAQALQEQARKVKTAALAEAAQKAPTAAQYACLDTPLPEDYLEVFRK